MLFDPKVCCVLSFVTSARYILWLILSVLCSLPFQALKAIIAFDTAGLALGWRFFDHAAHLGGALFGM